MLSAKLCTLATSMAECHIHMHSGEYRRWYDMEYPSGCSELLNFLEAIKNRHMCTSSWWSFWWLLWRWNDASVTAEHHAWEFNSLYALLVLVTSRPANCESLRDLGQSSTSANYSRFPEACLKRQNSCDPKNFGVLLLVLSRRKLSYEQFSSLFSLTTFTTQSSSVETGT